MKYVFIIMLLIALVTPSYGTGLDGVAGSVDSMVSFNTDGNCVINGFEIKNGDTTNPTNSKQLGWQLCLAAGTYSKVDFTQVTGGSYPGIWKASADLDIGSKCSIQNESSTTSGKATCND
jgi:hypothetical protein